MSLKTKPTRVHTIINRPGVAGAVLQTPSSLIKSISDEAVCRTAPATPGLLIIVASDSVRSPTGFVRLITLLSFYIMAPCALDHTFWTALDLVLVC